MSRSEDKQSCGELRDRAYRYRRGELIGVEEAAIEEHLVECAACRDYYARLGILLDAAGDHDTTSDASEADQLFAGIAARIEQSDEPAEHAAEESDDVAKPRRWMGVVLGAAAGVLLTLGAVYLVGFDVADKETPQVAQRSPDEAVDQPASAPGKAAPSPKADSPDSVGDGYEAGALELDEASTEQVRVFASRGAQWQLSGEREMTLELGRGSLLVEFIPTDGRTLRVDAPDYSVRVVGTVFYVSTDESKPSVGVLAGAVEVDRAGQAASTKLSAGRELDANFESRAMPESRHQAFAPLVDLDAHRQKLARLDRAAGSTSTARSREGSAPSGAPQKPQGEPKAASTEQPPAGEKARVGARVSPAASSGKAAPLPPDLERLRERAETASRAGRYHEAVRQYRALLEGLPPMHPNAASAHLDLARLYLHRLNSPKRATPHLRTFVERWPDDVAAPTARRELCKIAEQADRVEPACAGER